MPILDISLGQYMSYIIFQKYIGLWHYVAAPCWIRTRTTIALHSCFFFLSDASSFMRLWSQRSKISSEYLCLFAPGLSTMLLRRADAMLSTNRTIYKQLQENYSEITSNSRKDCDRPWDIIFYSSAAPVHHQNYCSQFSLNRSIK